MKSILYKLTDGDHMTRGDTLWGEGVTHEVGGDGTQLCSSNVIHAYRTPLQASYMRRAHRAGNVLWEARGEPVADDGTKVGCKRLTTVRRVELPEISAAHRREIAIRVVCQVYDDIDWRLWASRWLLDIDRSTSAAWAAAWAAAEAAAAADAAWAAAAAEASSSAAAAAEASAAAWAAAAAAGGSIFLLSIIDEVRGGGG